MTAPSRAGVVSSFTVIKGALIEESYAVLAGWDFAASKKANLDRLRLDNFVGARSETWLRDVAKVMNRRFDPGGRDKALAVLAKGNCSLDEWKPVLLWHITRDEFLLRDFLRTWLFAAFDSGTFRIRPEDVLEYLASVGSRGGQVEHVWSDETSHRVATGLLKMAVDFGLLTGSVVKEFASHHLPERSFLYLLHAMRDEKGSPNKAVGSHDWRMYLMRPGDVERELLHLHQFRKLGYHVAGSLVELSLPCGSALEYAERMVA